MELMSNLLECQRMLEKLRTDFPLPKTLTLRSEFHPGPVLRGVGRKPLLGRACQILPTLPIQQATIHVAIGVPLPVCLDTVAHEYYHVIQIQVLRAKPDHKVNGPFEKAAIEFAVNYTKEYMTSRCLM